MAASGVAAARMEQLQAYTGGKERAQRGGVIGRHRHDARVQHCGERPLVFPELRPYIVGQRDVRKGLPAQLAHDPLVLAIGVGMEERDRDRIDRTVRPHTGVDLEPQPERHRGGGRRREIVEHPPRLPHDVEDVAVSGGGEQSHASHLPLDDGVGDDGRAEGHHPRVRRLQTQGIGRDGRARIVPDAPDLGGLVRPRGPVVCHGVRERAADVHADAVSDPGFFHILLLLNGLLEYAVSGFRGDAVLP